MTYSARFDAALAFAACAHRTQVRKGSSGAGVPYIIHPVHVAMILRGHGFDEDLQIAGLLHDTVEDCDVESGAIAAAFGDEVAALVGAVTELKTDDAGAKRPWRVRKQEQLDHLGRGSARVAALKCADALHNAAATVTDVERDGAGAWKRFNAGAHDTVWYYRQIVTLAGTRLGETHPLVRELADVVDRLAASAGPPP